MRASTFRRSCFIAVFVLLSCQSTEVWSQVKLEVNDTALDVSADEKLEYYSADLVQERWVIGRVSEALIAEDVDRYLAEDCAHHVDFSINPTPARLQINAKGGGKWTLDMVRDAWLLTAKELSDPSLPFDPKAAVRRKTPVHTCRRIFNDAGEAASDEIVEYLRAK